MKLQIRRLKSIWFGTGTKRVLLEMVLIQVALVLIGLSIYSTFKPAMYGVLAVYEVVGIAWCTFRWRIVRSARSCWWTAFTEVAMTSILFLESLLSLELVAIPFADMGGIQSSGLQRSILLAAVSGCALFFCFRIAVRLWSFWDRLRRRYLRWALTHAHLIVVVLCTGTISVVLVLVSIFSTSSNEVRTLFGVVVSLFVMVIVTVIGLAVILPPSALFSYLFSRHLTRRIEKLAVATGALRGGNYSVRVAVEGEDEIARLQANFNAMAAELEHTLHELQEERDNVSKLLHARRELIASVSHELRTPVATVRSYLESTLAGWEDRPPPTLRQDLHVMEEQTIRLQSLIDDLFMLARAEVGKLELRCVPTNVELLVQRVVDTMAPVAWRSSRVEVVAEIEIAEEGGELPQALVDERRLEQIIQNLLHNGIRHTPPGGIVVVSATAYASAVVLQVKDTGEGIEAEELARIWERFYRTENARKQPSSGTGLGLAIVKELTEAMGGTVAVESVPGQGTCFTISMPAIPGMLSEPMYNQINVQASIQQWIKE